MNSEEDKAIMAMVKEHGATYKSLVVKIFQKNPELVRETLELVQPKVVRPTKKERTPEQKAVANQARQARAEHFDAFKLTHTEEEVEDEVKRYNAEVRRNRRELQKRVAVNKASDSEPDEAVDSVTDKTPPGISI